VTTCHCDGPPHRYDPAWCRDGKDDNSRPITPTSSTPHITVIIQMP